LEVYEVLLFCLRLSCNYNLQKTLAYVEPGLVVWNDWQFSKDVCYDLLSLSLTIIAEFGEGNE
jgi:hypothetical protein